jgi:hypothetical protein
VICIDLDFLARNAPVLSVVFLMVCALAGAIRGRRRPM